VNFQFKKGQQVVKMFYGVDGYREATLATVTKVAKGVAFVDEGTGITYDAKTGRELENFFAGMRSEITPLN
jgi:hypothetical protein